MKVFIKKTLLLSFVAFFLMGCMTAYEPNRLKKNVDSFNGTTWYTAKLTSPGWTTGSYVEAVYYPSEDRYTLYIHYHANDWIFMDQIEISINQTIHRLSIDDPSRDVSGGSVYEREEIAISHKVLERIASAAEVKFRVSGSDGSVILHANKAGKEALQELLSVGE